MGPAFAFSFTSAASLLGYSTLSGNEHFYTEYLMPTIHKLFDPEEAHRLAIQMAKYGLVPKEHHIADEEKFLVKREIFTSKLLIEKMNYLFSYFNRIESSCFQQIFQKSYWLCGWF